MSSRLAFSRPRAAVIALALVTLFVATVMVALPARAETTGSLVWGTEATFRGYVTGAGGTVTASGAASDDGSLTTFPGTGSTIDEAYAGTASYSGAVNFSYPAHGIDITLTDPQITITGAASAVLTAVIGGSRVDVATIALTAPTVADGLVTFTDQVTSWAEGGSATFTSEVGTAADPITFSFPVPVAPTGSPEPAASPAPEPSGPTITVSKTSDLREGDEITITGTGFSPNPPATTGTRPPLSGSFGGAYVVLGNFDDVWQPSQSAPRDSRRIALQKWAVSAEDATAGDPYIAIDADGSFTTTLTVTKGSVTDESGNWGIYTYPGSGATYPAFETYTPLSWHEAPASELTWAFLPSWRSYITAVPPAGTITATDGATDDGTLTSFPVGTVTAESVEFAGSVTYAKPGHGIEIELADPSVHQTSATTGKLDATVNGTVVTLATLDLTGIVGTVADGVVTFADVPATITASGGAVFRYEEGTTLAPLTLTFPVLGDAELGGGFTLTHTASEPTPEPSVEPSPQPSPQPSVEPSPQPSQPQTDTDVVGRLTWGIDSSFRDYVTGPIAGGAISVTGASYANSAFTFVQTAGNVDVAKGTGTASYGGSVRFTGHDGALDLTFARPSVTLTSRSTATLSLTVNGSRVTFATLNLGAGTATTLDGATRFTNVPATLTAQGAAAFEGFYAAGRALDPVTVTFGARATTPSGGTTVVAKATTKDTEPTIPSTPPATDGIVLDDATLTTLLAGGLATITIPGFTPGETVTIVIYSSPTVLGTVTADASGTATWTGSLPASLTGDHTLVFLGATTAKGIELSIPDRASAVGMCVASDATLTWGLKESFRAYIDSTIANGTWEADGVADDAGIFSWEGGTGAFDPDTSVGTVTFSGAVRFTGHDGALDTTIANPAVEIGADGAYLLLDVTGVTQEGKDITATGVRFATLDLTSVTPSVDGDAVTFAAVPAALTADGAAAFGTYSAGEELDPVTVTVAATDGCLAAMVGAAPEPTAAAPSPTPSLTPAAEGISAPASATWVWWTLAAIVVAAIAVALVLARRGRDTKA